MIFIRVRCSLISWEEWEMPTENSICNCNAVLARRPFAFQFRFFHVNQRIVEDHQNVNVSSTTKQETDEVILVIIDLFFFRWFVGFMLFMRAGLKCGARVSDASLTISFKARLTKFIPIERNFHWSSGNPSKKNVRSSVCRLLVAAALESD